MKLTRINAWHIPLTSHDTYYMADDKTCDTVETVLIAPDADEGLTGWGKVCPIPHYLPAYARGVASPPSEQPSANPILSSTDTREMRTQGRGEQT